MNNYLYPMVEINFLLGSLNLKKFMGMSGNFRVIFISKIWS